MIVAGAVVPLGLLRLQPFSTHYLTKFRLRIQIQCTVHNWIHKTALNTLAHLVSPPLVEEEDGVGLAELLVDIPLQDGLQLPLHQLRHRRHYALKRIAAALQQLPSARPPLLVLLVLIVVRRVAVSGSTVAVGVVVVVVVVVPVIVRVGLELLLLRILPVLKGQPRDRLKIS